MSDQEAEVEAAPRDASVGLATAMIVVTTIMLLTATIMVTKMLGDRYKEGLLASK